MRGRIASSTSSAHSTRSSTPARAARSSSSSTASSSTGCTGVGPSATTRAPDSSSERNSTSSMSSVIWSISARACSTSAGTSSPGSVVVSRSVSSLASGVRSSCETAAVKPARSSSYAARSPCAREVDETLAPTGDLVRDDERDDSALAGQEVRRKSLALAHAVDRLARPAAREQDAVVVVEDDDRLAALLDERPAPDRVGVASRHAVLTERLRTACRDLTAPELTCR